MISTFGSIICAAFTAPLDYERVQREHMAAMRQIMHSVRLSGRFPHRTWRTSCEALRIPAVAR